MPPRSGDTGLLAVSANATAPGASVETTDFWAYYGGFFFRPYTVPEPPELALIGIGLVGLAAARRNQKKCRRNA
ncbi:MAG: hypothetical protein B7Z66_09780 [Chromatiales bacterium 21-64-14]|nr:MAG: hypothetical protein B7Z66_09780 [Chromatiales bacterium 21-64-14]